MRIALTLEHFDSQRGGLEYWAWQLVQALIQRGHRVTVIAFESSGAATTRETTTSMDTILLPWRKNRLDRARAVAAALADLVVDVVHDLGVGCSADVLQPQMGCRLANYRRELQSFTAVRRVVHMLHPRNCRWLDEVRQLEHLNSGSISGTSVWFSPFRKSWPII